MQQSTWVALVSVIVGFSWIALSRHTTLPSLHALYDYEMDDAVMQKLEYLYPRDAYPGGHDVILPHGSTRYYRFGRVNEGQKIVFVHGIGIPCAVFGQLATTLAQDYDVLVYDIYGRGYSETPETLHDEALYTTQLALLLEHVGWTDSNIKFNIVGYSMGGAITASYAAFFGDRLRSIIFLAPAGLLDEIPIAGRLFQLPGIGEMFIRTGLAPYLMKKNARENFLVQPASVSTLTKSGPDSWTKASVEENVARILDLTAFHIDHHPGFVYSFLSTIRSFPLTKLGRVPKRFEQIGKQKQPVLVIWGTRDTLVPYSLWHDLKEAIPRAELFEVSNGGHAIPVENSTVVANAIRGFIDK